MLREITGDKDKLFITNETRFHEIRTRQIGERIFNANNATWKSRHFGKLRIIL